MLKVAALIVASNFQMGENRIKGAEVIESFRNNVNKSTTELAREDGMPSQPTIWRILNEAKFHPYKMNLRQELLPVNRAARVEHAINILGLIDAAPRFLDNILFSDECHFHVHGSESPVRCSSCKRYHDQAKDEDMVQKSKDSVTSPKIKFIGDEWYFTVQKDVEALNNTNDRSPTRKRRKKKRFV
uniref:Transposase n=1 Tax=Ditylenchus dipsaci TaxID=166011 RepID=A0A915DNY4_9BILA